jgi:hypothetical protein
MHFDTAYQRESKLLVRHYVEVIINAEVIVAQDEEGESGGQVDGRDGAFHQPRHGDHS